MAGAKRITQLPQDTAPTGTDKIVTVDVETGTTKQATLAAISGVLLPTGLILPYGGSAAPTGWLLCQGQAVSRTTYAPLFAIIGTAYGNGDGSTTFNLPDMQGRVPVGLNTSDSDFNTLGKSGGSKLLQAHSHTSANDFYVLQNTGWGATEGAGANRWASRSANNQLTATAGSGNSGNLQPFMVHNYLVKT